MKNIRPKINFLAGASTYKEKILQKPLSLVREEETRNM
jgi:hypothetical protein